MSHAQQPDSPGYWAFEGYISYAPDRIERKVVRVFWGTITKTWQTVSENGRRPAYMMIGKWWRLTMPWEQTQEDSSDDTKCY